MHSKPLDADRSTEAAEAHRLELARSVAVDLIAEINAKGGPFAHQVDCKCCGCMAVIRSRRRGLA